MPDDRNRRSVSAFDESDKILLLLLQGGSYRQIREGHILAAEQSENKLCLTQKYTEK